MRALLISLISFGGCMFCTGLAAMLIVGVVITKKVDETTGQILEIDEWATFWVNWKAYLCLLAALIFLFLSIKSAYQGLFSKRPKSCF